MSDPLAAAAFPERADYEKGFASYYAEHIDPLLDQLEGDRLDDFNIFVITAVIGGIIVIAVFLFLFFSGTLLHDAALQQRIDAFAMAFSKHGNDTGEGKFKLLAFAVIAACAYPGVIYTRYANEAKSTLLPPLLKFFGDLQYYTPSRFSSLRLMPFNILPRYTSYDSSNNVEGALDAVQFALAELKLVEGSGKNRHTTFKGLAVILGMNKPFEGQTILEHHCDFISNWLKQKAGALEAITLEDPHFNKQFSVYSSNQVEARYLLTTAFMERLMDITRLMGNWGKDPQKIDPQATCIPTAYGGLRASFTGNSLLLLIPCTKELFSPGTLFSSAFNINEIRCVLYQVHLLRAIIETLKLNQKIGM